MCETHIVECLRNANIFPEAFASSILNEASPAEAALEYDKTHFFYSNLTRKPQWWAVDFKRVVSISSYQISVNPWDGWIYSWTLSVSFDGKTWRDVDWPELGYPEGKTYTLEKPADARYARISGGNPSYTDPTILLFFYVKFFGTLSPKERRKIIQCNEYKKTNIFAMIIIIICCMN